MPCAERYHDPALAHGVPLSWPHRQAAHAILASDAEGGLVQQEDVERHDNHDDGRRDCGGQLDEAAFIQW